MYKHRQEPSELEQILREIAQFPFPSLVSKQMIATAMQLLTGKCVEKKNLNTSGLKKLLHAIWQKEVMEFPPNYANFNALIQMLVDTNTPEIINAQDAQGNNILHLLAGCGYSRAQKIIPCLLYSPKLMAVIDFDLQNDKGKKAVDIARQNFKDEKDSTVEQKQIQQEILTFLEKGRQERASFESLQDAIGEISRRVTATIEFDADRIGDAIKIQGKPYVEYHVYDNKFFYIKDERFPNDYSNFLKLQMDSGKTIEVVASRGPTKYNYDPNNHEDSWSDAKFFQNMFELPQPVNKFVLLGKLDSKYTAHFTDFCSTDFYTSFVNAEKKQKEYRIHQVKQVDHKLFKKVYLEINEANKVWHAIAWNFTIEDGSAILLKDKEDIEAFIECIKTIISTGGTTEANCHAGVGRTGHFWFTVALILNFREIFGQDTIDAKFPWEITMQSIVDNHENLLEDLRFQKGHFVQSREQCEIAIKNTFTVMHHLFQHQLKLEEYQGETINSDRLWLESANEIKLQLIEAEETKAVEGECLEREIAADVQKKIFSKTWNFGLFSFFQKETVKIIKEEGKFEDRQIPQELKPILETIETARTTKIEDPSQECPWKNVPQQIEGILRGVIQDYEQTSFFRTKPTYETYEFCQQRISQIEKYTSRLKF